MDLSRLSDVLGAGRLSFASADRLERYLAVKPGAVTVLALVNDETGEVGAFIDRELWEFPSIQCHPLENTATLVIAPREIERFLSSHGRRVSILDVPAVAPQA